MPKNQLTALFEDFANIFGKKPYKFNIPENLAKLDAELQRIALTLKDKITQKRDEIAAEKTELSSLVFFFNSSIELPPNTLNKEVAEKLAGYARLHEICSAADVKLDIMLHDSVYVTYEDGVKSDRNFAHGHIVIDTARPYSKSKLEINLKEVAPKSSGTGPRPE
jgi:hypothetical protein